MFVTENKWNVSTMLKKYILFGTIHNQNKYLIYLLLSSLLSFVLVRESSEHKFITVPVVIEMFVFFELKKKSNIS